MKSLVVSQLLAAAALAVALVLVIAQVEVSDPTVEVSRVCGSAFDGLVDRTGWEEWWAADLDEPDSSVREALVRTTDCPGALNSRAFYASGFVLAGAALSGASWYRLRSQSRSDPDASALTSSLKRLGTRTFAAGLTLTAAGLVGLLILVADSDATLFIYVDRLVITIVGLVVLIPPMALLVIGRTLSILSDHVAQEQTSP